ncbi:hypothetical protein FB451DRAFT_1204309 [Mycena latifolia]|nr:hypothetical protein FB451DRAFT_1204309 [Mycena latifolia]
MSVFADILTPGSSLNPQFLLVLDVAFASLLAILLALAFLTSGNIHIFALMAIELALWASVKWYTSLPCCKLQLYGTTGSSMN